MKTNLTLVLLFIATTLQQIPSPALDELAMHPSCSETLTLGQDTREIPDHQMPMSSLGLMIVQTICQENLAVSPNTPIRKE